MGERWDPQPFHVDPVAAADSVFGLVASSVHLFAIATCLGQRAEPHAAISTLGFRNVGNHSPVRPGDVLSKSTTVIAARLSKSRPGVGILTNLVELTNQQDELVFSCGSPPSTSAAPRPSSPVPTVRQRRVGGRRCP